MILAYATLYDQRGGTVEIEIKESKQGIGINRRSKKRFAAQQIVMLLSQPRPQPHRLVAAVARG